MDGVLHESITYNIYSAMISLIVTLIANLSRYTIPILVAS